MQPTSRVLFMTVPLIVSTAPASADQLLAPGHGRHGPVSTLYDNGLPDGVNGFSNFTSGVLGFQRTLLDDFVVPSGDTWSVSGLRWYHVYGTPMGGTEETGALIWFRSDDGGDPGAVIQQVIVDGYSEMQTGRVLFSREEVESYATFEPLVLPTGRYWFEAVVVAPENDFWLTASINNSECWVNYEDIGGGPQSSGDFGGASDIAWSIAGTVDAVGLGGACCFVDGRCSIMSVEDCEAGGGLYQGNGVSCVPPACGTTDDACCFRDGACEPVAAPFCVAAGGFPAGFGATCAATNCAANGGCLEPDTDYPGGNDPRDLAAGRLDADAAPDIVVVNTRPDAISVLRNEGDGTFEGRIPYDTAAEPSGIALGFLDQDLILDVVVTGRDRGVVAVHLNDGDGGFAPRVEYAAGNDPTDVATGDIDNDLDDDIVVSDAALDRVLVLRNAGGGVFETFDAYAVGSAPSAVALADLDGDHDPDLVVANKGSDSLTVLLNVAGAFGNALSYPIAGGPVDVVVGDLDGDGDRDVAALGADEGEVSILLNDGAGGLAADVRYHVGVGPRTLTIVDTPGDGSADLAIAAGVDRLAVLLNDGVGAFLGPVAFDVGLGPHGVAADDLNGDLRLDLVVSLEDEHVVTTLFNVCTCVGDLSGNGTVDFADVLRILGAWGMEGVPEDLDDSGVVDFGDLVVLLSLWGPCI